MSRKYQCTFNFYVEGAHKEVRTVVTIMGMGYFKDGFWVTFDGKLSPLLVQSDYWVPPSQILYVKILED